MLNRYIHFLKKYSFSLILNKIAYRIKYKYFSIFKFISFRLGRHKKTFNIDLNLLNFSNLIQPPISGEINSTEIKLLTKYRSFEFQILSPQWYNYLHNNSLAWHTDFPNNYVYKNRWYRNIKPKFNKSEIKRPWEFGRLQFLPQFAAQASSNSEVIDYFNFILMDFSKNNPVQKGVQWASTMDVSIRLVNIVISFILLKSRLPSESKKKFDYELLDKILNEHYFFIKNNLEFSKNFTNNHFLSNILGLLVFETLFQKQIVHETSNIFFKEIDKQFYPDGGNFEASTAYHKLSTEIALWGLIFIGSLGKISTPENIKIKIFKASKLLENLQNNQDRNTIPQFGDNDSGYIASLDHYFFLKGNKLSFNSLTCSQVLSLSNALFQIKSDSKSLNYQFAKSLLKKNFLKLSEEVTSINVSNLKSFQGITPTSLLKYKNYFSYKVSLKGLKRFIYPDFGVLILKSDELYLAINFSKIGQNGRGGHSHNDKLSFDLSIKGCSIFKDPGSGFYTSNTNIRNRLRSIHSHNVPSLGGEEQNSFHLDNNCLFLMNNDTQIKYDFSQNTFLFECRYRDNILQRLFELKDNELNIQDFANKPLVYSKINLYSPNYGEIIKN